MIKRIWRNRVNQELNGMYKKYLSKLIVLFFKSSSFKHVFKWRLLQEKKLIATAKGKKL